MPIDVSQLPDQPSRLDLSALPDQPTPTPSPEGRGVALEIGNAYDIAKAGPPPPDVQLPEAIKKPAISVADYIKGMIPTTGEEALHEAGVPSDWTDPSQVAGFAFPWMRPGLQIPEQAIQRFQQIQQAEETPPWSQERWDAGIGTAADLAGLGAMVHGAIVSGEGIPSRAEPSVADAIRTQTEVPPVQPQAQVPPAQSEIITPELGDPFHPQEVPPQDVPYVGGEAAQPQGTGISQARTEDELGPGSVEPGIGAEMGSGLAYGRNYINAGGDPRLPIRRANTSGMVGKNDVGIVHAELERLRGERSTAAAALEANPADPVLQNNFANADNAQRAWRKELQPVLTKASDSLREAYAMSLPNPDVATYQGLVDLMDEHFKGERELTEKDRTALAKAAKGVKGVRDIANNKMKEIEGELTRKMGGKRVMTPAELDADLQKELQGQFADCFLGK